MRLYANDNDKDLVLEGFIANLKQCYNMNGITISLSSTEPHVAELNITYFDLQIVGGEDFKKELSKMIKKPSTSREFEDLGLKATLSYFNSNRTVVLQSYLCDLVNKANKKGSEEIKIKFKRLMDIN